MDVDVLLLTHRRVRLATATLSGLLANYPDSTATVVVNGAGGIDEAALTAEQRARVDVLHLPENLGPAAGYRHGMEHLRATSDAEWVLVSEDDLADAAPPPRDLPDLARRIAAWETAHGRRSGAVASYSRTLDRATGLASPDPPVRHTFGLAPTEVAAWGSTLVRRDVLEADVLPDPGFFFGYEDFDWFLRVADAGFTVLLDHVHLAAFEGRTARVDEAGRPLHDDLDAWRLYYSTREFFRFARRHGRPQWLAVHLAHAARRAQLSDDPQAARAVAEGARDGWRGRTGRHDAWLRA